MVEIAPFRALRYASGTDLPAVTSPPHDCIPPRQREQFLADAHNIAHIVLSKQEGGDAVEEASRHLHQWQDEGILVRDGSPALYLYELRWGHGRRMRGLVCRLAVDADYSQVRRHELTLPRKKEARFRLRKAIGMDPEPIWLLYRDDRGWVDEVLWSNAHDEIIRFTDEEGHEHRVWRIDRPEAVGEVVAQFEDRTLVIADGHHRYQTAVEHWQSTGRDEDGSIMVCLVRDNDPGIDLVATHRLVRTTLGIEEALARLGTAFTPRDGGRDVVLQTLPGLGPDGALVVWKDPASSEVRHGLVHLEPREGRRLQTLTVTRAHDQVLHAAWGLDPDHPEDQLAFSRAPEEALDAVAHGECELALMLPPEPVEAVLEVAADGDVMPQKSTYFIPKLRSGLLLGPLDEPRPRSWKDQAEGTGTPSFRLPL